MTRNQLKEGWKHSLLSRPNALLFVLMQALFSLIIALLTAAADPLFLNHSTDRWELHIYRSILGGSSSLSSQINSDLLAPLYFAGAVILILGGLFYTGRTDRGYKWKKTLAAFALTLILSLLTWIQLNSKHILPMTYSFIYLWRFCAGIFYLMIFWDSAVLYFDSRSAKKVFPMLALSGTLFYALGSLAGASPLLTNQRHLSFLIIAVLSLIGIFTSIWLPRRLKPVSELRYRQQNLRKEFLEGFSYFMKHPYLKSLGMATVIFGLTSGFIMFTYNQLVSSSSFASISNGRFMALQRAAASTAQTLIFVLMMSQGKTGRRMIGQIVTKFFFLLLGILGFLISMLGVADFSRAVATALMSPITIASFSLIPAQFRGRALSLNSIVLTSVGMLLSSGLMYLGTLSGWGPPIFLAVILLLLISRIAMNFFVNKGYLKSLSRQLRGNAGATISDNSLKQILNDPETIEQWLGRKNQLTADQQQLLWSRIANQADRREHWQNLSALAPSESSPGYLSWLQICGQCAPDESKDLLQNQAGLDSAEAREALKQCLSNQTFNEAEKHSWERKIEAEIKGKKNSPELWQIYLQFFPDSALEQLQNNYENLEEAEKNLRITQAQESGNKDLAYFFINTITPETFHQTIQFVAQWNDWKLSDIEALFEQKELSPYGEELTQFALKQKDTDIQNWLKEEMKQHLKELDQREEEFISYWFHLRETGQDKILFILMLERLKRLPGLTGLEPARVQRLKTLFFKVAAELYQYTLPHRLDSLFAPYQSLTHRLFLQEYKELRRWILLFTLLPRGNSHSRETLYEMLMNKEQETQPLILLELLDNLLSKKERKTIALLLEPMGDQLRRIRFKPYMQNRKMKDLLQLWLDALRDTGSISARLLKLPSTALTE